jgi:hypothetical protein
MLASWVLAGLLAAAAAQADLSRADALEILKKASATAAAPIKQSVVLSTRCTIGGKAAVPDDLAMLERNGLIKVTQSPLDPTLIAVMASDGVNQLLGSIPDACIFTIRNTYGGMAGLVASGQREFNVMDVAVTDAGRAMGLGPGYSEIAIAKEEPDEITNIVKADAQTRRVEYKVRYVPTDAGKKSGLADVFMKKTGPTARSKFLRNVGEGWRLVPDLP